MVVDPRLRCCGRANHIYDGIPFILEKPLRREQIGTCTSCGSTKWADGTTAYLIPFKRNGAVPEYCLKKIDPPKEGETNEAYKGIPSTRKIKEEV